MRRLVVASIAAMVFAPLPLFAQDNDLIGETEGITILTDFVPVEYNEQRYFKD